MRESSGVDADRREPNLKGVGLTAHYTAAAWAALGVPEASRFVTRRGRLLFGATAPLRWLGPAVGLGDPVELLLASRHHLLEERLGASGARAFLELAAGLSPRGAAYARDPAVTYVEVDLPHMSAAKDALLGRDRAPGHVLVPGDATTPLAYAEARAALAERGARPPVAVVAEGLNAYLPRPAFEALLREVAAFLRAAGGGVFLADLNPAAAAGRFGRVGRLVLGAIRAVARSPLYMPVRDAEDAHALYRAAGFDGLTLHDPESHPASAARVRAPLRGAVLIAEATVRGAEATVSGAEATEHGAPSA